MGSYAVVTVGPAHQRRRPRLREEAAERVLGVHPRLDGVAGDRHVVLGERQLLARGDRELEVDEVQRLTPDRDGELGDRVLDLEAGVHLQEEHLLAAVLAGDEELDGAGVDVAHLTRERDRAGEQRGSGLLREVRGRGLLEHLLVPALCAAVTVEEVDDVAVAVGEDLHLDVAPLLDVPLHQDRVVAERRRRLAPGRRDGVVEVRRLVDDAHALAAAAGRGLHEDGEDHVGRRAVGSRHDRHPGPLGDLARPVLAAHRVHRVRGRADEREAGLGHGASEF
jgi:hypothetical protein